MTEVKKEISTPAMFNKQQSKPAELIDKAEGNDDGLQYF
jgi:hypothetical protein